MRGCLEPRLLVVCMDRKCAEICRTSRLMNCVHIDMPELPPSEYRTNAFAYVSWFRLELMREALTLVEEVYCIDADILLFLNPWVDTRRVRTEADGSHNSNAGANVDSSVANDSVELPAAYDFMYQREKGHNSSVGCGGDLNGGQLYLRRTALPAASSGGGATAATAKAAHERFYGNMLKLRTKILRGPKLDQDYMIGAASAAGLRYCSFPPELYTSHCVADRRSLKYALSYPLRDVISYHTSCVKGYDNKVRKMRRVMDKKYGIVKAEQVLRTPLINAI